MVMNSGRTALSGQGCHATTPAFKRWPTPMGPVATSTWVPAAGCVETTCSTSGTGADPRVARNAARPPAIIAINNRTIRDGFMATLHYAAWRTAPGFTLADYRGQRVK